MLCFVTFLLHGSLALCLLVFMLHIYLRLVICLLAFLVNHRLVFAIVPFFSFLCMNFCSFLTCFLVCLGARCNAVFGLISCYLICCLPYTISKTTCHHLMKVWDEPKYCEDHRGEKNIKKEPGKTKKRTE